MVLEWKSTPPGCKTMAVRRIRRLWTFLLNMWKCGRSLTPPFPPRAMEKSLAPRPWNVQRAAWRQKCREILANHLRKEGPPLLPKSRVVLICSLESQLGVIFEPTTVRLIPIDEDGYVWMRRPEREHLFQKQLSKHSIGAIMELIREVNVSFEAVPRNPMTSKVGVDGLEVCGICFLDRLANANTLHRPRAFLGLLSFSNQRLINSKPRMADSPKKFLVRGTSFVLKASQVKKRKVELMSWRYSYLQCECRKAS